MCILAYIHPYIRTYVCVCVCVYSTHVESSLHEILCIYVCASIHLSIHPSVHLIPSHPIHPSSHTLQEFVFQCIAVRSVLDDDKVQHLRVHHVRTYVCTHTHQFMHARSKIWPDAFSSSTKRHQLLASLHLFAHKMPTTCLRGRKKTGNSHIDM